jgi:SAM-dependent methyltransferase
MPDRTQNDRWAVGEDYEAYVGRWSRRIARAFVDGLGVPPGSRWIDVGCGTGALARTILDACAPQWVVGVDPSPGFLDHARNRIIDPRIEFRHGDACALPIDDGSADAAVAALVLNFVPDPPRAIDAMRRAVRPGGVVAAYVWDYAGGMQPIRRFWDVAVALDPAAVELDEGRRFPICRPDALSHLWRAGGLGRIEVHAIEVPTLFADFDDYWTPFLGGQGPAPGYCMSLPEHRRRALRDGLASTLPVRADGSIPLVARAWAVRGVCD